MSVPTFQELQQKVWKIIVKKGCEETSVVLTDMLKTPLAMTATVLGFIPINKIPFLAGNPEQEVTGARMVFSGDVGGHMLLILPHGDWQTCKELLLRQTHGKEDQGDELEFSAFAEMANLACSFFIANLANVTGLTIHFTPPEVMSDMTATVLEDTLVELSEEAEDLLTIETTLSSGEAKLKGFLFFIPSPASVKTITQRFLEATSGQDGLETLDSGKPSIST